MTTVTDTPAPAHQHAGGIAESKAQRHRSFDVASFPELTGSEEDWRFTPLARLAGLHEDRTPEGPPAELAVSAPSSVRIENVARTDDRLGACGAPSDRIAAVAWKNFDRATVVTVPAGVQLSEPVMVQRVGRVGVEYGHTVVTAAAGSHASAVLDYRGHGAYAENLEISVADNADLTVLTIHDGARDAVHASAHQIRLGHQARLTHIVVSLGGDLVRVVAEAQLDAADAQITMLGLAFTDAGQHHEHRLLVDHQAPHCRSNVTYKTALHGAGAHGVWVGDVLIRAAAVGTDTYELNRNLALSPQARADSVPNLEIETGEIQRAGHASATGRFDDEQLFYLCSRGIDPQTAQRLVVRGFFADVLAGITIAQVQERISVAIDAELEHAFGDDGQHASTDSQGDFNQ